MASILILANLESEAANGSLILYHFFSADQAAEPWLDVLRHLIFQAVEQTETVPPLSLDPRKMKLSRTASSVKKLVDVLLEMSQAFRKTFIVLDGLDEYQHRLQIVELLPKLKRAGIKIVATSRNFDDIRKDWGKFPNVEIKASKGDIGRYVEWQFEDNSNVDWDYFEPSVRDTLKKDLMKQISSTIEQFVNGS
jgi:hypothetical protein